MSLFCSESLLCSAKTFWKKERTANEQSLFAVEAAFKFSAAGESPFFWRKTNRLTLKGLLYERRSVASGVQERFFVWVLNL